MGLLEVQLDGGTFKLWLGMSVLADLEDAFPDVFPQMLAGTITAVPPLRLVHRTISLALERHHPDKADDRFFVDELINANAGIFSNLFEAASPPSAGGNGQAKAGAKAAAKAKTPR